MMKKPQKGRENNETRNKSQNRFVQSMHFVIFWEVQDFEIVEPAMQNTRLETNKSYRQIIPKMQHYNWLISFNKQNKDSLTMTV